MLPGAAWQIYHLAQSWSNWTLQMLSIVLVAQASWQSSVSEYIPELYSCCHLACSKASNLKYGEFSLQSQSGLPHGDPLGSLLFCLPIQPILLSLQSSLRIGYLDDLTLDGTASTVATDVQTIIREAGKMGLALNFAKCEIINTHEVNLPSPLDSFTITSSCDAFLLGHLSRLIELSMLPLRCAVQSFHLASLDWLL